VHSFPVLIACPRF